MSKDMDVRQTIDDPQHCAELVGGRRFSVHAGARFRHLKRGGAYTLPFGRAEACLQTSEPLVDGDVVIIYVGDDGMIWARPPHEFFDGRFQLLTNPATGLSDTEVDYPSWVNELADAEANSLRLLAALRRLMAAERAASKADREAITATRFEPDDRAAAFAAQGLAGREVAAAWEEARNAIAMAEGAQ